MECPADALQCATRGALGKFIQDPRLSPDDGLAGPVIGKGQKNLSAVRGGAYAPSMIEGCTKVRRSSKDNRELDLYYVLSTWNPYVVVLMSSRLQVAASKSSTTSHPGSALH